MSAGEKRIRTSDISFVDGRYGCPAGLCVNDFINKTRSGSDGPERETMEEFAPDPGSDMVPIETDTGTALLNRIGGVLS